MIFWEGKGWVVVAIWFFSFVATQMVGDMFVKDYYVNHAWMQVLAMSIATIFVHFFTITTDTKKNRIVIDKETRKEFVLQSRNSLFFVPLKYWASIFFGITLALYLSHFI